MTTVHSWGWVEDFPGRGRSTIVRQPRLRLGGHRHGDTVEHYWTSGFLARISLYENDELIRSTTWRRDGSVMRQEWRAGQRVRPPWKWGVEAQTAPTAPWWDARQGRAVWWPRTR